MGRELRVTRRGLEVLRGGADRVALAPLDRWLLGTRVAAPTPWRWDPAAGRVRRR
jgi:hypothetical protein